MKTAAVLKDLGGGLVMRRSTRDDADRLAEFNSRIHGENPFDVLAVAEWTRDLLRVPPPNVHPDDFLIVEDSATGAIVSSMDLISQEWTYEGIPFGVGRPELVGTDPQYRQRGLVREMFPVIHEWSRQRGELAQAITGIPNFYRQFGYDMALNLGGGRNGFSAHVPQLPENQDEPYNIRPACEADLPWVMQMYALECRSSMLACIRGAADWRNELFEKSKENVNRVEVRIIETREGQPVGYLDHPNSNWGTLMAVTGYRLAEGVSYQAVTPSVLRYIWKVGQEYTAQHQKNLDSFGFRLNVNHPVFAAIPHLLPKEVKPYAYFIRVADLPAFLRKITPVLEERLGASGCAGYTGEMKISFYRSGIRLVFEQGALKIVEAWKPKIRDDEGQAAFPEYTFLQLLFGYRSLDELRYAYADCTANDDTRVLLNALFPQKPSFVWAIS